MKTNDFVIWRDVPVLVTEKKMHIHSLKEHGHKDFCTDFGDIPVARFNLENDKLEPVDNHRGLAYAKRRDASFHKRPRYVPPVVEE